jgi:hypothetical protein
MTNSDAFTGITPVHVVNSPESAEMVIKAGSNLSAKTHRRNPYNYTAGANPLRVSVDSNNLKIVKVLAKYSTMGQLDMKAADGKSVLEAAFDPFKRAISEVLLEALERLEKEKEEEAGGDV